MKKRTNYKQLTQLCSKLIQIQSLFGQEQALAKFLVSLFQQNGFTEVSVDQYGSVLAGIKGNSPGSCIVFDAHMDTVPVDYPDQWKYPPFSGKQIDGKIYGRGTTDMKGALSAMVVAACDFAQKVGHEFKGSLYIAAVVCEEILEGVSARYCTQNIQPDLVIIGEPSGLDIAFGQKGRAEIIIETFGKPAHSSQPQNGVNAIENMMALLQEIATIPLPKDPYLGDAVLVVTDIKSEPYPGASVIPHYCRATLDRRLLIGETEDSVLDPIRLKIKTLQSQDPLFKASVSIESENRQSYTKKSFQATKFFPAWKTDIKHPLVKKSHQALLTTGLNPQWMTYPFCTNASYYAGHQGIPTIGFGPSYANLAHINDEYIDIEQLTLSYEGYYTMMINLLTEAA